MLPLVDKGNFPWKNRCWGQSFICPSGFTVCHPSAYFISQEAFICKDHLKGLSSLASIWVQQGETFSSRREQGEWAWVPARPPASHNPRTQLLSDSLLHTHSQSQSSRAFLPFLVPSGQGTATFPADNCTQEYCLWFPYTLSTPSQWVVIWNSSPATQLMGGILSYRNLTGTKYNCLFFLPWNNLNPSGFSVLNFSRFLLIPTDSGFHLCIHHTPLPLPLWGCM